jgi:hypothetical protein
LASNPGIKAEVEVYYKARLAIRECSDLKLNIPPERPPA